MIKKLIFGVLGLVIVGLIGATVYLNMIDWNQHKASIAQQFAEATGKNVAFNGSVSFHIFPTPSLEAADIDVYNHDKTGQKVTLAKINKVVASLSVRSLIQGKINVEKMTVVNPEIFIEGYEDGTLNWESAKSGNEDFAINNVEVSFGSVMLEDAKLHFINKVYKIDSVIANINAEVIAGSLFGPYRIEGSYVKDGTPGGFALDLGKFSDSFATSVNMVISHPQSESYVRFDGTVLLKNDAVNGNIVVESKNPVNFINSMFSKAKISEDYEYPLAMSLAVKSDKTQIALSNIVVKYAESAGAGNILIPRKETQIGEEGMQRRRIDLAFNMAELNLEPVLQVVEDFLKKYDGKNYIPEYNFDIIGDVKSVKTTYKNQVIRDFDLSFDFMDNTFVVQKFSAQLPFDGVVKFKGELFSVEKVLTYNFDIDASTLDFAKTANWLGYKVNPLTKGVYKKASTKFNLSGTLETIKASPFVFNMDKTSVNAKLAWLRKDGNKYFVIADVDNINLDNYIEALPEAVLQNSWENKVVYRFKQLAKLNNLDIQFRAKLNSGIWNKIPFEKVSAEAVIKDGVAKFSDFSIGNVASAQVVLKGEVSGFGGEPKFKNLKYGIAVADNKAFTERMGLEFPKVNFDHLLQFDSKGVVTGGLNRAAIKAVSKLGNIDNVYKGEISKVDNVYYLNGKVELNNNDMVRMLNDFSINYNPEFPLGLIKMSSEIKGSVNALLLKNMDMYIGSNHFVGDILFSKKEGRNLLKTNLKANKFEFERFIYNKNTRNETGVFRPKTERVPFLPKPALSKAKIDYSWLKNWDMEAKINVDDLSLQNYALKNTSWTMVLNKQILKVAQFIGEKENGLVNLDFELNTVQNPKLSGKLVLNNMELQKAKWSGSSYGIEKAILEASLDFNTSADSVDSVMSQISGTGKFNFVKPVVKGWDLSVIEADLESRVISDGFKSLVQENLSSGETMFNSFSGEFKLENGSYNIRYATFDGDTYAVDLSADGNLGTWSITSTFTPIFKTVKNVSGLSFTLDGNINAPSLEVDVSPITDVYDANEKQAVAQAKAEQDAKVKKYRDLMDEQQERAEKSKQRLNGSIVTEFKAGNNLAENEKMKRYYSAINKQIVQTNMDIAEVTSKKGMADIDDDVIAKLKTQNDLIEERLSKIERDLTSTRVQDVRLRIREDVAKINEIASQSQTLPARLLDITGEFGKRLAAFNADYYLEGDAEAENMKKQLEKLVGSIDEINIQVGGNSIVSQGVSDIIVLEKFAADFRKDLENVSDKIAEAEKILENYEEHVDSKITAEEKAYQQKLEDEAIKQKLSENTGKIATAGGKTVTVERDLEEINRSEQAIQKQGKVLDFSSQSNSGVIRSSLQQSSTSNSNDESSGGLILRVSDGEEIESGGRIVK